MFSTYHLYTNTAAEACCQLIAIMLGGEVVVYVVVHCVSGCSGCEASSAHRQSGLHTVESTFVIKISF